MSNTLDFIYGVLRDVLSFLISWLLFVVIFVVVGVVAAWIWNMYAVPAGMLPLAWWECALGLLVLRWILAFLLPNRVK